MERRMVAIWNAARSAGLTESPLWRNRLAAAWIDVEIVRLLSLRLLSELEGGVPSAATSVLKLRSSEGSQRLAELGLEVDGVYAQLDRGSPHVRHDGARQHDWLLSRAATIASGTSEVQRTIIAERLLGLPRAG
jgi:alkylation response protein AidB-like acyl-CoA dehydrogenase